MAETERTHFIEDIINEELAAGKNDGRVHTRFPPEPNGHLHIGHAKAICLSFGLAEKYEGKCNLRFDDTNPTKESTEYVDAIKNDIRWLGFDWEDRLFFASDYFETLYGYALHLIDNGNAYVCELNAEDTRKYRGTLTEPGKDSPYRDRPVEESRELFEKMRAGDMPVGAMTLRAKIDMAHPNLNMRDPVIYRILHEHHHRTGDAWPIYPTYDFTHGQSDAIEHITHSLCSLEFENHRPLYDWFLDNLPVPSRPRQIEFARLNLTDTVMSKRKLRDLVEGGHVDSWDDPRMPTISGIRRRGYTPASIREFCNRIGIAKYNSTVDLALLEHCLRDDLNRSARRALVVLDPLKVVITNYPEGDSEEFDAVNNPEDPSAGTRKVPFSREIYIERADFKEEANRKYFRLKPGKEVRLRYACYVTCTDFVKDPDTGEITEVHCTYDPESRRGSTPDGRKVKGTIHWVSAAHAVDVEVRQYDRLFLHDPSELADGADIGTALNPDSLTVISGAKAEPGLASAESGAHYQFERSGYYAVDPDTTDDHVVFNRSVSLKDSWAKIEKKLA